MIEITRWLVLPAIGIVALMAVACSSGMPQPQEREVSAGDVTLYARIVGDPTAGEVLIGISGGPGLSCGHRLVHHTALHSLAGHASDLGLVFPARVIK